MTLPLEHIEGKYEILQKIKEGGMGAIYKVRHRLLEEVRVVKVIRPQFAEDEDLQRRFTREAKTAIRLRHPNVAQLYDFAAGEGGTAYMVMEFIDGHTLQETLAVFGSPSLGLAVDLLQQALKALHYLHSQGYVHRDISPDNLMMTRDFDQRPMIKLIDLGIVKRLGAEVNLTTTGTFLGKVRYSSPEQFNAETGSAKVDARSDVYSFGLLTYELLTGRFPIPGENFSQLLAGHLMQPPLDFATSDPGGRIPDELRRVILRALEKKPEDRFASAREFADELDPFAVDFDTYRHEFERRMSRSDVTRPMEPIPRPGSTQERLNEQFGVEPTPAPTDVGSPPPPPPADPEAERKAREEARAEAERREREVKIAELLAEAFETKDEDPETARAKLQELLELEPEHSRAQNLQEQVEADLQRRREEAERQERERTEALESARAAVTELLDRGHLDEAQTRMRDAANELDAEFPELERRLEELQAEAARRAQALEDAHAAVADLLDREDPDAAEARLEQSEEELEVQLPELRSRLVHLRAELTLRKKAQETYELAREAADADDWDEARKLLFQTLDTAPEHPEARALLNRVDAELRRRQNEAEKSRRLAEAVAEIERHLDEEKVQTAARELDFAVETWGGSPELVALARRIDEEQKRWEHQEALGALLAQAREDREAGRLEDAVRGLRELLALQPEHREARSLLASVEADVARRDIERAAAAVGTKAPPEPTTVEPEPIPGMSAEGRATVPVDSAAFPDRLEGTAPPEEDPAPVDDIPPSEAERSQPPWMLAVWVALALLVLGAVFWFVGASSGESGDAGSAVEEAREVESAGLRENPPAATDVAEDAHSAVEPETDVADESTPDPRQDAVQGTTTTSPAGRQEPETPRSEARRKPEPSRERQLETKPSSPPPGPGASTLEPELTESTPPTTPETEDSPPEVETTFVPPSVDEGSRIDEPAEIQATQDAGFQRGDLIQELGPGVEQPVALQSPTPSYPLKAREARYRKMARIVVLVLVDEDGRPSKVRIADPDKSGLGFNEAALAAAREATFQPATKDGVPGKMWARLVYGFRP